MPPISRSPNDPVSTSGSGAASVTPSRVTNGVPAAPLRSMPKRRDPADESTLTFLGSSPLDSANGGAVGPEAGSAGATLGAVAGIAQNLQTLAAYQPGLIPPEITAWLQNLMQIIPQVIQQQQSAFGGNMAGTNPTSAPSQLGPTPASPMAAGGGAMAASGGAGSGAVGVRPPMM